MNLKSVIDLQMILKILYSGARLNFMFCELHVVFVKLLFGIPILIMTCGRNHQ